MLERQDHHQHRRHRIAGADAAIAVAVPCFEGVDGEEGGGGGEADAEEEKRAHLPPALPPLQLVGLGLCQGEEEDGGAGEGGEEQLAGEDGDARVEVLVGAGAAVGVAGSRR